MVKPKKISNKDAQLKRGNLSNVTEKSNVNEYLLECDLLCRSHWKISDCSVCFLFINY